MYSKGHTGTYRIPDTGNPGCVHIAVSARMTIASIIPMTHRRSIIKAYPEESGLGILRDLCGRGYKRNQQMGEGGLPADDGGM